METLLVWVIVASAALFAVRRLLPRRRRPSGGSCNGSCSTCTFSATSSACGTPEPEKGRHKLTVLPAVALALVAGLPAASRAADTIETFDPGAADLELYFGMDGLGTPSRERAATGELVLGYGVIEGLSVYVATALETDGRLGNRAHDASVGLLSTPLDGEVVDLDLLLDVGGGGDGFRSLWVAPGVELNVDLASPLGTWGPYLRLAVPVNGERHENADGSTTFRTDHAFDVNPGLQWTPREGHQLLAEYVLAVVPGDGDAPDTWENGGASLGYNVSVLENLELITQASLAPGDGDRWVAGLMAGFIATIPGAE